MSSFTTLLSRLGFILVRADVYYDNSYLKKKNKRLVRGHTTHTATLGFVVSPNLFFFCYHSIFLTSIYTIVIFSLGDETSPFYSRSNRQFAVQIEISCVNMSNVRACTVDIDIGYANA